MKRAPVEVEFRLPEETVKRLREVAKLAGVSLQTVLKVAIAKHVANSLVDTAKAGAA